MINIITNWISWVITKIQNQLGVPGYFDCVDSISRHLLPCELTQRELLLDISHEVLKPLSDEISTELSRGGGRFFGIDGGSFKSCKGLHLPDKRKTKLSILTVSDHFGNYIAHSFLPDCKEKHEYIVPVLAKLVWKSLY
eukprot:337962_1